jgi:hypothetical protein
LSAGKGDLIPAVHHHAEVVEDLFPIDGFGQIVDFQDHSSRMARSGLKAIQGYLRDETGISSRVIFSRSFFRDVACLALEALELKRRINAVNSLAFSVAFLFPVLPLLLDQAAGLAPEVVVAREHPDLAVVDIGNVGTDLVEEVAVMGDHDHGVL